MKYIIWGAGRRGKWTNLFLGSENVIAFIDGDKQKIGQKFCGKKIITFQEAEKLYQDYIVIITPLDGSDEIQKYLENLQFYKFFKLDDLPMNIPCDERDEYSINLSYNEQLQYGLIGVNLFSIYLYEKMQNSNTKVRIYVQQEINAQMKGLLQHNIVFSSKEEVIEKSDRVIVVNEEKNLIKQLSDKGTYISAEDFVMNHMLPERKKLCEFYNVHKNKRCFIVATGPSLRVEDLDKLYENNDICISMNRIFNIFDRTVWRPDYYMICDTEMIEDLSAQIADLKLKNKFVATEPKSYWNDNTLKNSISYKLLLRGYKDKVPYFSENFEKGLAHGTTVTYLCIQLAVYMGFSEIYLLGVDFNYTANVYDAQNHFEGCDTPQNRVRLNPIYPERTLVAYKKAAEYCKQHGIKIYNATRGGKLEVFERVNFDSLFE